MIKISIKYENDQINNIIINGHAGYDIKGKDIVCASVSSIVITSLNAITRLDKQAINIKQDDGFIEVEIKKHNEYIDIIIENMISLLKELKQQYKQNIEIYE